GPDMAMLGASLFATHGILGALYHKWRTGEGQHVDVSMLGTMLFERGVAWAAMIDPDEWAGFYCEAYLKPPDCGYKTADQPIVLGGMRKAELMHQFLKDLGAEGYMENPLFQHLPRDIMGSGGPGDLPLRAKSLWEKAFQRWKAEDVVALLQKYRSTSSLVNSYQELFSHPQTAALGMVKTAKSPGTGRVRFLGPPWKMDGLPSFTPEPYGGAGQ
ncbi:MAG: CoA transferase, partial [Chloroflexi bacterium]|nr:CoA transferase [Chloroflexota bacterium]